MINIVGVEFLINFGGLGQLINELAERYDLPGHVRRDLLRGPGQHRVLRDDRQGRAMAAPAPVSAADDASAKRALSTSRGPPGRRRTRTNDRSPRSTAAARRQAAARRDRRGDPRRGRRSARSGLLFRDVVPSLVAIGTALGRLLANPDFYGNLGVDGLRDRHRDGRSGRLRAWPSASRSAPTASCRARSSRSSSTSGPTPKIIFFPVMIMWFGVGAGSKIAMGVVSCFFPVAHQRGRRHAGDRPRADPRGAQLPRLARGRW